MRSVKRKNSGDAGSIPVKNSKKKSRNIAIVVMVTVALIIWVLMLGANASSEVDVVMYSQAVGYGDPITKDNTMKYSMNILEFD